jgi:hypothetical protein
MPSWGLHIFGLGKKRGSVHPSDSGDDRNWAIPDTAETHGRRVSLIDTFIQYTRRQSIDDRRGSLESVSDELLANQVMYCNEGDSIGVSEVLAFNRLIEEVEKSTLTIENNDEKTSAINGAKPAEVVNVMETGSADVFHEPEPEDSKRFQSNMHSHDAESFNDLGWSRDQLIRRNLLGVSNSTFFRRSVLLVGLVHSGLVIRNKFPMYVDISFASIFTLELGVQVLARGLRKGKLSYLNSSVYNRLNCVVTLSNWVEVCFQSSNVFSASTA